MAQPLAEVGADKVTDGEARDGKVTDLESSLGLRRAGGEQRGPGPGRGGGTAWGGGSLGLQGPVR